MQDDDDARVLLCSAPRQSAASRYRLTIINRSCRAFKFAEYRSSTFPYGTRFGVLMQVTPIAIASVRAVDVAVRSCVSLGAPLLLPVSIEARRLMLHMDASELRDYDSALKSRYA